MMVRSELSIVEALLLYWLQVSLMELSCWYPAVLLKFAAFDPLLIMVWPITGVMVFAGFSRAASLSQFQEFHFR